MRLGALIAPAAALLAAGCVSAPPPTTAHDALRPYYAQLALPLPRAPPGAPLPRDRALTRIAFGSCDNQDRPQAFWNAIAAARPDLFLMIGDNVYGDTRTTSAADLPTLRSAYGRLSARGEFRAFRAAVPMLATWDDHDYGYNDAGGSFAFKEYAERIFEHYWGSDAEVRARPGIQHRVVIGPAGQRVQIILLDTRFFRSDLVARPYQDPSPSLGWYVPNPDPDATLLGEAQWRWLEEALAEPAELRLIVSSIQVVTSAHGFESWANFPRERDRLYALLDRTGTTEAVLLSGDRHQGGLYRSPERPGLYEITSSSLNFSFSNPDRPWVEPDPTRLGELIGPENFGMIEIDWASGDVALVLHGSDGAELQRRRIAGLIRR